jgi:hypothetical protein
VDVGPVTPKGIVTTMLERLRRISVILIVFVALVAFGLGSYLGRHFSTSTTNSDQLLRRAIDSSTVLQGYTPAVYQMTVGGKHLCVVGNLTWRGNSATQGIAPNCTARDLAKEAASEVFDMVGTTLTGNYATNGKNGTAISLTKADNAAYQQLTDIGAVITRATPHARVLSGTGEVGVSVWIQENGFTEDGCLTVPAVQGAGGSFGGRSGSCGS